MATPIDDDDDRWGRLRARLHPPAPSSGAVRNAHARRAPLQDGSDASDASDASDRACLSFQCLDVTAVDHLPAGVSMEEFEEDGALTELPVEANPRWGKFQTTVLVFGTALDGRSVMLAVRGFRPFVYLEIPGHWAAETLATEVQQVVDRLDDSPDFCRKGAVEWELCGDLRHRLYGFEPARDDPAAPRRVRIVKVSFRSQRGMGAFARAHRERPAFARGTLLYEDGVSVVHKFLDATRGVEGSPGVEPCGWVDVQGGGAPISDSVRYSHCDVERRCELSELFGLPDMAKMAPFVVASTDIECFSERNAFPDAEEEHDRVICIGTTLQRFGRPETRVRVAQCLLDAPPPPDPADGAGLLVRCYASERELLEDWRYLMIRVGGADVITGYNLHGFDFKYMDARAKRAGASAFWRTSKLLTEEVALRESTLSSNALGQSDLATLPMRGRVTVDLFQWIKSRFKLGAYGLNAVSEHFLGERKVDLDYKVMNDNFRHCAEDPSKMWEIARYCAQDCDLPLNLLERLQALVELGEMARITMTVLEQILSRGQQIRVFNQIVLKAHDMGYVVNPAPPPPADAGKYEGATVLEAEAGFYDRPIATLDFASLYPSIMQARNLCYSTYVCDPGALPEAARAHVQSYDVGGGVRHTFATGTPGVLPRILRELLDARAAVRKRIKTTECAGERALLQGRQLAIKVSANSVYGFTGAAARGMYPNPAIAQTTTAEGRRMIERSKAVVEGEGCRVIYGDTDSVMVDVGIAADVPRDEARRLAFAEGARLAALITKHFADANVLMEMEKISFPYLLLKKKRYVGLVYEEPDGEPKIDAKGIELVRRDTCAFSRRVMSDVVDCLMHQSDAEGAVRTLKAHLERMVQGEVPFEDFVLSKALRKDYAAPAGARGSGGIRGHCGEPLCAADALVALLLLLPEEPGELPPRAPRSLGWATTSLVAGGGATAEQAWRFLRRLVPPSERPGAVDVAGVEDWVEPFRERVRERWWGASSAAPWGAWLRLCAQDVLQVARAGALPPSDGALSVDEFGRMLEALGASADRRSPSGPLASAGGGSAAAAGLLGALQNAALHYDDALPRLEKVDPSLAHLAVVRKMQARREDAPRPGDRVRFVIYETKDANANLCDKVDCPAHVQTSGKRLDLKYYVEHQIRTSVSSLFAAFDPNPGRFFDDALNALARRRMGVRPMTELCGSGDTDRSNSMEQALFTSVGQAGKPKARRRAAARQRPPPKRARPDPTALLAGM